MENSIEYNGNKYTEDEVKEAYETFKNVWNRVKEIITQAVEKAWKIVKDFRNLLQNHTPVGYKRMMKMNQINYYKSISEDKSNNWMKQHGLSLRRRNDTDV